MESMEKLWRFYCAPECQKGLIEKREAGKGKANDFAIKVKGNFSWGVTPKLDQADKDKLRTKIKDKAYKNKTEGMGKIRKALFDMTSKTKKDHDI